MILWGTGALEILENITRKHPCRNWVETAFHCRCFPWNFSKIFRAPLPQNTSEGLLLFFICCKEYVLFPYFCFEINLFFSLQFWFSFQFLPFNKKDVKTQFSNSFGKFDLSTTSYPPMNFFTVFYRSFKFHEIRMPENYFSMEFWSLSETILNEKRLKDPPDFECLNEKLINEVLILFDS